MTILIISGVSCAGKSHLLKRLQEAGVERVVTTTTRAQRPGEINGVDYHFMSWDDFSQREQDGKFLETNKFGFAKYGTDIDAIKPGKLQAIVVDPNGHRNIKAAIKKAGIPFVSVFLDAEENEQVTRFFARALDAIYKRAKGRSALSVVSEAQERIANMLRVEQHWRDVANCRETPYDLVIPHYDGATEKAVVQELMKRLAQAA